MKIAYASRTGNVQAIIDKLKIDNALQISTGGETIDEDFILITYTDGWGDTPAEVESFLETNPNKIKGVIVSGDLSYGEAYCAAGDTIAQAHSIPCLYKVENDGTDEDISAIAKLINE